MKRVTAACLFLVLGAMPSPAEPSSSSPVIGRWLSESGNGVIELYPCDDRICGKLVWLQRPMENGTAAVDSHNPDPDLRHRPLCGLQMLGDFRKVDDRKWSDGWIYNPEDGKTYSGSMTLESSEVLKLRGYVIITLLGKTETWTRPDPAFGSCTAAIS
jgi:uncharacterized protein (DUF2147 family)